jgi:DNA-binding FadR family transcriptional regulator
LLTTPEMLRREDAIAAVRTFIADGGYSPGDRLPPERELTVSLNMTRTTLRRALEALENEGSIWRHVGKGTFVAASAGPGVPNRLKELISRVSPVDMMRARLSLEPAIAREAASHASEESVRRIRRASDLAVEAPTWEDYEAKDDALHRIIAEATGSVLLLELFDTMNQVRRAVAWNSVIRHSARPPRDHTSFAEHERIAQAIAARKPAEAHAAMRAHLNSVSARLFEEL